MDMTFKEFIQQVMYIVIVAVLPFAAKYLASYVNSVIESNKDKIKDERLSKLIDYANEAISVAVISTSQTYVDALKKNGKFDAAAQKVAKEAAIAKAKELLSTDMRQAITTVYNNLDTYLDNYIESLVRETKVPKQDEAIASPSKD